MSIVGGIVMMKEFSCRMVVDVFGGELDDVIFCCFLYGFFGVDVVGLE